MAEEQVVIIDVGSASVKAGYSGEDLPSCIFPTSVAQKWARGIEV